MPSTNNSAPVDQSERNVEAIMRMEEQTLHSRTVSETLAERAIAIAGSPPFVGLHVAWFGCWILINSGSIRAIRSFDHFPFSFLTLIVSLEAIFLTLLVLMSQKRSMRDADKRAHLDLQVSLLAEQESTETLRLVRLICKQLNVREPEHQREPEAKELEKQTDVERLAESIESKLPE